MVSQELVEVVLGRRHRGAGGGEVRGRRRWYREPGDRVVSVIGRDRGVLTLDGDRGVLVASIDLNGGIGLAGGGLLGGATLAALASLGFGLLLVVLLQAVGLLLLLESLLCTLVSAFANRAVGLDGLGHHTMLVVLQRHRPSIG
jgi:hypothetical protein